MLGDSGEYGYRVRPDDYYLADLGLTADETAALRVAVSAVSLGDQSGEGALMKLGGVATETASPIASLPIAPALATLFEAFRHRAVVTFEHRGQTRTVEVWGLSSKRGHWYVVGWDRGRDAVRAFRADRIEGDVTVGETGAFTPPDDFRPDDHIEDRPWMLGDDQPITVQLRVDREYVQGALADLRGDATVSAEHDGPNGSRVVEVELTITNRPAFRSFVLGLADHAEVVAPQELRDDIVRWLEAMRSG
jgi:predicted DNA-binding transcriptional regulator YafY